MPHHLKDEFEQPFNVIISDQAKAEWREEHRCRECRRVTDSRTRKGNEHWPYCSKATIEQKYWWARREELRPLRTIRRVGED